MRFFKLKFEVPLYWQTTLVNKFGVSIYTKVLMSQMGLLWPSQTTSPNLVKQHISSWGAWKVASIFMFGYALPVKTVYNFCLSSVFRTVSINCFHVCFNSACDSKTWGPGCSYNCSPGCVQQDCDPVNGQCRQGCYPGLLGDFCDESQLQVLFIWLIYWDICILAFISHYNIFVRIYWIYYIVAFFFTCQFPLSLFQALVHTQKKFQSLFLTHTHVRGLQKTIQIKVHRRLEEYKPVWCKQTKDLMTRTETSGSLCCYMT